MPIIRFIAVPVLMFLALPVASAVTPEQAAIDADAFDSFLELQIADHAAERAAVPPTGDDLFPLQPGETDAPIVLAKYVTVTVGGVSYDLTDVPAVAWFAPYVRDVAAKGIVSGYKNADGTPNGLYGPARDVSMEELAKIAVIAAGGLENCGTPRNAAAVGRWSEPFIACAEQAQFAVYVDGTVVPDRPATRAEVVMTLLQAFGTQMRDVPETGSPFTDVTASTLFASAIYTASQDGLVVGYADEAGKSTGLFGPGNPVNRAELAKMVSVGLQLYASR